MDSSKVGTNCILIDQFPEGKGIISFNSRVFDKAEQKTSTLHRELCGVVSVLQTYEHYFIGSPYPIYLYCVYKPIAYLWGRKGQLSHSFFRYQVTITKFQNLKIIQTPGLHLAFPDILSRNVTIEDYQMHQLQHVSVFAYPQRIPRDLQLFDEHGTPVTYQNQHEDNPNDTCNDFYPKKYTRGNEEKILRSQNDGEDFTVSSMHEEFPIISIQKSSTVSEWQDLSTNLDEYMGQGPNQVHPSTHPIRTTVQSIPIARPKMTQQTRRAPATTHITSVLTLKMTILYVISVFKLTKPDSVNKPNKLTTSCSGKLMLR